MKSKDAKNTDSIQEARRKLRRSGAVVAMGMSVVAAVVAGFSAWLVHERLASGPWSIVATALVAFAGMLPISMIIRKSMESLMVSAERVADRRQSLMDSESRHRNFDHQVADALEMADNEAEAIRIIERSFVVASRNNAVELLLADNSHAHMTRTAFASPTNEPPGCLVSSPQDCPAARRGRVLQFRDSADLNTCSKLEGRTAGRCSALCIPVSVMGHTVGVVHSIGAPGHSWSDTQEDLEAVANQAGHKLAILRVMAETQMQASTDGLTGLLNRRAFENDYRRVQIDSHGDGAAIAMADLDHFKNLNDTYGHDTGDRALRVFAEVLRSGLRTQDLISRRGGEEFAIFFPGSDAAAAVAGLQRVQHHLHATLLTNGLPIFTVSFGVVEVNAGEDLDHMLTRADAALFAAKEAGRDRVIVHDRMGEERLYPATAFQTQDAATAPSRIIA